jgi:toxin ParE1/3/4
MRELGGKFELLANNREIGRREDDFIIEMRMFPFKKYHIYYFPTETGVEIYRVMHGARDNEGEFENYFEGLKE